MAGAYNIPFFSDSGSYIPISGSTPNGYYDNDPQFQSDSLKFVNYAAYKLGYPIVRLELQYVNFYQAFEEAVTEFGKELWEYKIRENYISFEGNSTATNLNNVVITPSLGTVIRIAETYASEAGVGGNVQYYTGSLPIVMNQQVYDLEYYVSSSLGITGSIEVKRVFFESPPAIVRFFDPYAGTGTGLQSLMQAFGFGQYSPGINFMLMPVNFDVLTIQAIEFNDQIRRSAYSFNIVNNKLWVFPIPTMDTNLSFSFIIKSDRNSVVYLNDSGSVNSIANVPYTNLTYSLLNSPTIKWIFDYGTACVKEILGNIRGKFQTIDVPKNPLTLNGPSLITEAREEKKNLIDQLRATLEETSRTTQLAKKAQEAESIQSTLRNIPMPIYIM